MKCGYVQAHQACETIFKFLGKKWYGSCKNGIAGTKNVSWKTVWNGSNESVNALLAACPEKHEKSATTLKRHKRVFVISAGWDSNYHHFMLDSLTRLVRHLAFLKANPDIMIHIRASEQGYKKQTNIINGRALRARMFGMVRTCCTILSLFCAILCCSILLFYCALFACCAISHFIPPTSHLSFNFS